MYTVSSEPAKEMFDAFCERVRSDYEEEKVAQGVFGAMMAVELVRFREIPLKTRRIDAIFIMCTGQRRSGDHDHRLARPETVAISAPLVSIQRQRKHRRVGLCSSVFCRMSSSLTR